MSSRPMAIYGAALRRAADGNAAPLQLVHTDGVLLATLDPMAWTAAIRPGDQSMLARCHLATLDVGCGPGRLTDALRRAGRTALGIDVSPEAVRQARRRGAWAMCRDVFGSVPAPGKWGHVLLIDGNIGIGGDPRRLLRRCAELVCATGTVLVETAPPGTPTWSGTVMLRDHERQSQAFAWASVSADDLAALAEHCALRQIESWQEAGRWFARLTRS